MERGQEGGAGRWERRPARISARELVRSSGIEGVIFDMDGVLADTEEFHLLSWQGLLAERFGLEAPPGLIRSTFGQSNERILPLLVPAGRAPAGLEVERLSDEKEARYREAARGRVRPLPGVEDLLAWLSREGIPAAIGTSGPPENIRFLLEEFGWRRLFRALIDRSRFARSKPAPDCFLLAAERLGVAPRRSLVFEDSLHGLAAARRAGMAAAGIATTYPEEAIRLLSRWTFRDFTEIAL
jgi:beta-phosphoglucomutase